MQPTNGKGRRGTSQPTDPSGPDDANVVPLFAEHGREDLVPLGRTDGRPAANDETIGSGGAWSEQRPAELLDVAEPSGRPAGMRMDRRLGRPLRIALSGLAGAAITAGALALLSNHETARRPPIARAPGPSHARSASQAREHTGRAFGRTRPPRNHRAAARGKPAKRPPSRGRQAVTVQQVSYRPGSPSITGSQATQYTSSAAVQPTTSSTTSRAATSTTGHTSGSSGQPAFGASGALGPGSSPNG